MGTPREHQENPEQEDCEEKARLLKRNISILKGLLFLAIVLTGGLTGSLSYSFIRKYESKSFRSVFFHASKYHYDNLQNSFFVQANLNVQLATSIGLACPTEENWPNCELSNEEMNLLTHSLREISPIDQFLITPIVRPEERKAFESFAMELYNTDPGYENRTGVSDFGFGIFDLGLNGEHVQSPNHTDPSQSRHDLFAPILLSSTTETPEIFLTNIYSLPLMDTVLDGVLACVNQTRNESSEKSIGMYSRHHHHSFLADSSPILSTEHSAIFAAPIFPHSQDTKVVGFSIARFVWRSALSSSLPQDFNFQCTIESSTDPVPHYYLIERGEAREIQKVHSPSCSDSFCSKDLKRSFTLEVRDVRKGRTVYTITYHPIDDELSKLSAIIACVCCLGVSALISAIFVFFNILINKQVLAAALLLDSKRTYVKFISHEIRLHSPVSLSLSLSLSLCLSVPVSLCLSLPGSLSLSLCLSPNFYHCV
jgi:hypothetical protein